MALPDQLFVTALEVRNVLGVRAIALDFNPEGELVLVGGENAQGKTSYLTGLLMAIEGAAAMPDESLRRGAGKGSVRVVLSDREGNPVCTVERTITPRGTTLVLRDAEGAPVSSPQGLLSSFVGAIGFDPLEFERLAKKDPQKAGESLRKLVGLDFRDLDDAHREAYAARTEANREARKLEAQVAGLSPFHKDAPTAEVSVAALAAELDAAQAEIARREEIGDAAQDAIGAHATAEAAWRAAQRAVEEAQARLDECRKQLDGASQRRAQAELVAQEAAALPPVDVDGIRAQLAASDETNRRVRENEARKARVQEAADAARRAAALDERISEIEAERRLRMTSAKYPIDGLAFADDGTVTLHGVPFAQASDAQRAQVSLAIGMALNPRLRALVIGRSGNDLDRKAIAHLREIARERGFLILGERVGDGSEVSVVIEDGAVIEDRRASQES